MRKTERENPSGILHAWYFALSNDLLAVFLSFLRFGYINQQILLSAQTGSYHFQQKSQIKIVRYVFKPITIPCCLLLSQISSSDWLQSYSPPPPSCPHFSTLLHSGWPSHFSSLTLWPLLLWLCSCSPSLDCFYLPSLPTHPNPDQPSQPPLGHPMKYPPNQPEKSLFFKCL